MTNSTEAKHAGAKPSSLLPGILQRKCACGNHTIAGGECAGCGRNKQTLQRATRDSEPETRNSNSVPAIVHDVLRSSGQPLDGATRSFFEPRFGRDFSHVRVHTDARAAESAFAVNALAYTVGSDVVFGQGQYRPQSGGGRSLLAHELTHVVQQQASRAPAMQRFGGGTADDPLEREADQMSQSASGERASAGSTPDDEACRNSGGLGGCKLDLKTPPRPRQEKIIIQRPPRIVSPAEMARAYTGPLSVENATRAYEGPLSVEGPAESEKVNKTAVPEGPENVGNLEIPERPGEATKQAEGPKLEASLTAAGKYALTKQMTSGGAVGHAGTAEGVNEISVRRPRNGKERVTSGSITLGRTGGTEETEERTRGTQETEEGKTHVRSLDAKVEGKLARAHGKTTLPAVFVKEVKASFSVSSQHRELLAFTNLGLEYTINALTLVKEWELGPGKLEFAAPFSHVGKFDFKHQGRLGHRQAPWGVGFGLGFDINPSLKYSLKPVPLFFTFETSFKFMWSREGGKWLPGVFTLTPMLNLGFSF